MRSERFEFPNSKGEKLAGVIDLPLGEPTAFALFAHCFTCGKDSRAAKRIAERLSVHGIATLRMPRRPSWSAIVSAAPRCWRLPTASRRRARW
jgi:hypothetical protein